VPGSRWERVLGLCPDCKHFKAGASSTQRHRDLFLSPCLTLPSARSLLPAGPGAALAVPRRGERRHSPPCLCPRSPGRALAPRHSGSAAEPRWHRSAHALWRASLPSVSPRLRPPHSLHPGPAGSRGDTDGEDPPEGTRVPGVRPAAPSTDPLLPAPTRTGHRPALHR